MLSVTPSHGVLNTPNHRSDGIPRISFSVESLVDSMGFRGGFQSDIREF
jgi:hypothetical protein